jgi:hypothetical protein
MQQYLIYISQAMKFMNNEDLLQILEESKARNGFYRVTGMLLYMEAVFLDRKEGRFMQILEGERKNVQEIYAKIAKDSRHKNLIILSEGSIEARIFTEWTMGLSVLPESDSNKHFFDVEKEFGNISGQQDLRISYLSSFYRINTAGQESDLRSLL